MHRLHHHIDFLKNRELNELYLSIAIRAIAVSMINLFIPIYLLKLNYSLPAVLTFFIIANAVHAFLVIPAAKISAKFGFKHSILFSMPCYVIFYLLLYSLEQFSWPLLLLAIVFGTAHALYWTGYLLDFCKFSDKKHRGREISIANIIGSSCFIIGPIIGGFILTTTGAQFLLILVSIILLLSALPLFASKDIHRPLKFKIKELFKKQETKNTLAFLGFGIESGVAMVIWPIIVFFSILGTYTKLGFLFSIGMAFSLLVTYSIGKFSDINRKLTLRIGAIITAILWVVKVIIRTPLQAFTIDSAHGMSKTLVRVPFNALSYDKANKTNAIKFIIRREIYIQLGRVILFSIILLISNLTVGLFIGGAASLLYLLF